MSEERDKIDSVEQNEHQPDMNIDASRRQLLKSIGVGGASLAAVGSAKAEPTASHLSESHLEGATTERIKGRELAGVAHSVLDQPDVRNVQSKLSKFDTAEWDLMNDEIERNDDTGELKLTQVGTDEQPTLGINRVSVSAATHDMTDGNKMTAVAYVFNDDHLISYYRYNRPVRETKTEAQLWRIEEGADFKDTQLVLGETSANGDLSQSDVSAAANCTCWPDGKKKKRVCTNRNLYCEAAACGACALSGGVSKFLACVAVLCPLAQRGCCRNYERQCHPCRLI